MAFTATGVDVDLQRQPDGTFDLVFDDAGPNKGNPRMSDSRVHAVLFALLDRKRGVRPGTTEYEGGTCWDPTRGSLLWTLRLDVDATRSQAIAYASEALQRLVALRVLASFTVDAARQAPGRYQITCTWVTVNGDQKDLTLR